MKKVIWISLGASLILVNLAAWLAEYFSGFYVEPVYRFILILGITFITGIFVGAFMLVNKFEEETPLTGHTSNTLQDEHEQIVGQNPGKEKTNEGKTNE